jgi:meso-butanediol dehydrogenase / (S,S)-butanediol dehydrogenase / diacetyl reductase
VRLEGKVALVTGGGTGIGAAVTRRFAAEGARVVIVGRRRESLERVAAGTGAIAVVGDATRADDVRGAIGVSLERYGGLDVLVANAGGLGTPGALETDDAQWAASIDSNVTSSFVLAREALPALIERSGAIIVMASLAGRFAAPEDVGYVTAKHALIGLTRSLARDYGPRGVRVNAVCPGWTRTEAADEIMDRLGGRERISRDEAYALATSHVPLRRPAAPEEIAAVCAFLASDESSIVTGAVVPADGGASVVDLPTVAFEG